MRRAVQTLRRNKLLLHNIIFFTGALVVGALNYLYYPVLGRLVSPTVFGEVQTLVSLFLQLNVLFGVLGLLTVSLVKKHESQANSSRVIIELEKLSLIISILMLGVVWFASGPIQEFFRFSSGMPFVILALTVAITVPFTFRSSYLRGHSFFGLNSWALIIGAASKLLFSVGFIIAGLGTTGAILGIALAQLLAFLYAAWQAKRHGFDESLRGVIFKPLDLGLIKPELAYAGLVLVCTLLLTCMYSADIVIVKRLFDAHTAGLYAGVAAVARIPFFLTASIPQVLMSSVHTGQPAIQNHKVLRQSFILIMGLGGASALFFWLLPDWTITLLMGQAYSSYAHLLPQLGLSVFIISVINLFVTYYLALRRWRIGLVVVGGAVVTTVLMILWHGSLEEIVNSLLAGSIATMGLFMVLIGLEALWRTKKLKGGDQ